MCRNFGLVQNNDDRLDLLEPHCRSWSCPDCGPQKKRDFERMIFFGQPNKMLTLTLRRTEGGDPLEAADRLLKAWGELQKRRKRKWPKAEFAFGWVVEPTEAGWPHLHAALRSPFWPQSWIEAVWKELTGDSDVVWIQDKSAKGCAMYLSKYLAKNPKKFGNHKRFHASRNFAPGWKDKTPRPKVFGEGRWVRINEPPRNYKYRMVQQGYYPEPLGPGMWRLWARGYWPERFRPPREPSWEEFRPPEPQRASNTQTAYERPLPGLGEYLGL